MTDPRAIMVGPKATIREVMTRIDATGQGIVLVVDDGERLRATVTDGDVRRAILAGRQLDQPVEMFLEETGAASGRPVTVAVGTHPDEILHLMNQRGLRHIPVVDHEGRVIEVAALSDMVKEYEAPLTAVVMAGGYGTRLRPLTEDLPKPMLPMGGRPLMEWIMEGLREAGIRRVSVTTHYKGDVIARHFGDGEEFGLSIDYVNEEEPLGTAGSLGLLSELDEPFLVINGDILTRLNFRAMVDFHQEHEAAMTVGVFEHLSTIPYGVVETEDVLITAVREKPVERHLAIAGVYVLDPQVRQHIPSGERFDMPDLIDRLLADGQRVISFPISEYWQDIGQIEAYEQASADILRGEWDR